MLVKYPGLTVVGGLAMAFAIWAGVVSFVLVGQIVHPTLPLPDGDRIVVVERSQLGSVGGQPSADRADPVGTDDRRGLGRREFPALFVDRDPTAGRQVVWTSALSVGARL
jgi:hypothetical protein